MNFTNPITLGIIPKGYRKYITPEVYDELDDEHQYYYEPEYKKYRTKKVRTYSDCEECGHKEFLGWEEEKVPVGEPHRYISTPQLMRYGDVRRMVDNLSSSNVLMDRILSKPKSWHD